MADDSSNGWDIFTDVPDSGGDCECQEIEYVVSQATGQTGQLQLLQRDTPIALNVGSLATVTGWASAITAGGMTASTITGIITGLDRGLVDVTLDLNLVYSGIEQQVVEVKLLDAVANEIGEGLYTIGDSDTPAVVQFGGDTGLGPPRLLAIGGESNSATFGGVPNSYSGYTFPENGVLTELEIWRDNTASDVTFNIVDGAGAVVSGPHVLLAGVASQGFTIAVAVLDNSVIGVQYTATASANPGLVTAQVSWKKSHTKRLSVSLSGTLEIYGGPQTVQVDAGVVTGAGPVTLTSATFKATERNAPLTTELKTVCACPVDCPALISATVSGDGGPALNAPQIFPPGTVVDAVLTWAPAIDATGYTFALSGAASSIPAYSPSPLAATSVSFTFTMGGSPVSVSLSDGTCTLEQLLVLAPA